MGMRMSFSKTGPVMDKLARDGAEFGHVNESLRDSLLNGAKNVEFGIHGLYQDKVCVARRYIADDGTGMDHSILTGPYSNFAESGTTHDFQVTLDDATGALDVVIVPQTPGDKYHSRNGIGGRQVVLSWNQTGVVTVTVRDGKSLMVWMYRSIDGDLMMRQYINDQGRRTTVIEPYSEPEHLYADDLREDLAFSKMLLVRSGFSKNEEEADEFIKTMNPSDRIANPFFGLDWDENVVPKWIIDRYEDGVALREDGSLAHGTVKMLLGDSPTSHTAVTGDPNFINERVDYKYHGVGNQFWVDLTPWNVSIWAMKMPTSKEDKAKSVQYTLAGEESPWILDTGSTRITKEPSGRTQKGAIPLRTLPLENAPTENPVELKTVLDLGAYGRALVVVRKDKGSASSPSFWGTSRRGRIGIVYGNEIHGLKDGGTDTQDYMFRAMGIPTYGTMKNRISVFFFPPRASDTVSGVYQSISRDRLKWSGLDGLPLSEINVAVAEAIGTQAPDLHLLLNSASTDSDDEVPTDIKKAKALFEKSKSLIKSGGELLTGKSTNTLIACATGTEMGDPVGPQGSSGPNKREPCPECGLLIHAADCSRKPTHSGGGGGGTGGPNEKLTPNPNGTRRGRTSKAKASGTDSTPEPEDEAPEFPTVNFISEPPELDEPMLPATYVRPAIVLPKTGTITVNREHASVKRLFGSAAGMGRDEDETKKLTELWIKARLIDVVLGTLSLKDQELAASSGSKDLNQLAADLDNPMVWFTATASMLMGEDSLKQYVAGNAAKKRRIASKSKAAKAAA